MFEVRLLGPVEVWEGGRRAPLGGSKPLAVLAALVVHLGEVLSTERLVDCVWDERAPATAGALVATHVSALRRALARLGAAEVVRTRPPGYLADLAPAQVDARRFEELLAAGRGAAGTGRPQEAVEALAEALGLWRGREALEGLGQSFARIESARLAELRLVAQEESFGLLLELGREDETIAPLLAHVAAHPLRERSRGQLMTALFRTGRVSDALRTYRDGRALLRDELGIDPGPELRSLHQAVLTNDTALLGTPSSRRTPGTVPAPRVPRPAAGEGEATVSAPGRVTVFTPAPSHLPPDIADFVGRSAEVAWATRLLEGAGGAGRTAPPIGVISGRSGTGKTALAVHVGHRTAELFPDGRLFIDLRAADATPLQPADALARLLRAMGTDAGTLPGSLEELTGLYRTHVGHRRVLLILDNAAGEAHVRPLLPPGAGSAVLVTSRRRLVALEGAAHLDLSVPGEQDALELLRRVAGTERRVPSRSGPRRSSRCAGGCRSRSASPGRVSRPARTGRPAGSPDGCATNGAGSTNSAPVTSSCAPAWNSGTPTSIRRSSGRCAGWLCWACPTSRRGSPPRCWTSVSRRPRRPSSGWWTATSSTS